MQHYQKLVCHYPKKKKKEKEKEKEKKKEIMAEKVATAGTKIIIKIEKLKSGWWHEHVKEVSGLKIASVILRTFVAVITSQI